MTREAQVTRVDQLLGDRTGVPWVEPSAGLKARTLAALEPRVGDRAPVAGPTRWLAAAAVLAAAGVGAFVVLKDQGIQKDSGISVGRMDPTPLLAPAFRMLTVSADESLASEARELIESANQLTRRVVAQLPFTGGG